MSRNIREPKLARDQRAAAAHQSTSEPLLPQEFFENGLVSRPRRAFARALCASLDFVQCYDERKINEFRPLRPSKPLFSVEGEKKKRHAFGTLAQFQWHVSWIVQIDLNCCWMKNNVNEKRYSAMFRYLSLSGRCLWFNCRNYFTVYNNEFKKFIQKKVGAGDMNLSSSVWTVIRLEWPICSLGQVRVHINRFGALYQ